MTCDVCGRPERREYLAVATIRGERVTRRRRRDRTEPLLEGDPGPLPPMALMACRRCRLEPRLRELWDAMHAAEVAVISLPDSAEAMAMLREARIRFDSALHPEPQPTPAPAAADRPA